MQDRGGGPELATTPVALCPGGQGGKSVPNFYVLIVLILTKNYNNRIRQNAFFTRFAPAARNSSPAPWMPLSRDSPPLPWITSGTLDVYDVIFSRWRANFRSPVPHTSGTLAHKLRNEISISTSFVQQHFWVVSQCLPQNCLGIERSHFLGCTSCKVPHGLCWSHSHCQSNLGFCEIYLRCHSWVCLP